MPSTYAQFQKKILSWYAKNKRDLPWRTTTDPYKILVSEIMLQQTQVDRVISYYTRFLKELPNFEALAKTKKESLLKSWSGLGYNSRVLRLQKTAQEVVEKHKGKLPENEKELLALPGIGPYTANAVLAFAFNKPAAVVDTNIRRVLIHELQLNENISLDELKNIALSCIPKGKSRIWHNALMDYGAMEKTARKTGIASLSKQSAFEGSTREARGKILKRLLKKKKIHLSALKKEVKHGQFDSILEKMKSEGIVACENETVYIAKEK